MEMSISDKSDEEQAFEYAVENFVHASPRKALIQLTGLFVTLTLALIEDEGHSPEGDILIEGGKSRNITIHAPKAKAAA